MPDVKAERLTYSSNPIKSNWRWVICGLLFMATTINYMDRQVFSLIEPILKTLPFMGYNPQHPQIYTDHFSTILAYFQVAYGIGFLIAGRFIDKVGTKIGYAIAILVWALASMSHALVGSVAGFCLARIVLGLGESGNFPAAIKATTEWFPTEERAKAVGIFNSGTNLAALVAPLFIPWVTYYFRYADGSLNWHAGFIATGSMGMFWLVLWLFFPYNRLRRGSTLSQERLTLPMVKSESELYSILLKRRGTWAFALAKMMTDPIWWFYLFWLPKYFNERYGLDMKHIGLPLVLIYLGSSIGSISGGWLSGFRIRQGHSVNSGRKFAMLVCALCVLPVVLVPYSSKVWEAVALLALAAAAHQGWSANLFSTPTDMFPSGSVSTIVGIGGTAGAIGGAIFTKITGALWTNYSVVIFIMAALAYVTALLIFQKLVPRLGEPSSAQ